MNRFIHRACAALPLLAAVASAQAFTYSEAISGDLSGDRLAPSILSASDGVNTLAMSSLTGDRDYFTFTVPTGWLLSSVFHKTYVSADNLSFFALQAGTTLTEPPTGTNPANLLGYFHFGDASNGTEIIDNLAASGSSTPAAQGFTAPLASGSYTFWVQQTGVAASYSFDFVLTAVPEPESYALMALGLAVVGCVARRRRG